MLGRPSPVPSGMLGVCRWSPSGRISGAFSQSVAEGCSSQQSECFCPQLGHSISHKTLAAASLGSGSSSKVPKTQIPSKPSWLFTCYSEDLFAPSCASKLKWKWQWFKAITKEAKRHEQVSMGNRWVMPTANNLFAKLNGSDKACKRKRNLLLTHTEAKLGRPQGKGWSCA